MNCLGSISRFVVAGSLSEYLRTEVISRGLTESVELAGWTYGDEKLRRLRESDVFILPSYTEGLPNALLEGMAAGLAVICTPVGGIPEVVHDPDNGLLVPPEDPVRLSAAIRTLTTNLTLRCRMGERNRSYVHAHHDLRRLWPMLEAILRAEEP